MTAAVSSGAAAMRPRHRLSALVTSVANLGLDRSPGEARQGQPSSSSAPQWPWPSRSRPLSSGPVVDALLASAALPGVFPPVTIGGRFLKGHGLGEFDYPTDVALRPDGTILVADAYNHRLQALKSNGEVVPYQYDIGKSLTPPLMVPTGVALDDLGRMHVADSGRKRVVLLSASGALETEWKLSPDAHPETYSPTRAAVRGKRVYYVDTSNDRVVVLEVR